MEPARPLLCLLLGIAGLGIATGCGGGDPDHLFVRPETVEFARILHGDVAHRTVTLTNGGEREVYVTNTIFTCTCFQLRPFNQMLKPGEKRELEITWISSGVKPGPMRGKKLDIISNDSTVSRIEVGLEGDSVRPFTVVPLQIDFGSRQEAKPPEPQTVSVRPGTALDLDILSWRVQPTGTAVATKAELDGGADFEIRVDDSEGRHGPFRAALVLRLQVGGDGFAPKVFDVKVDIAGE